MKLSSRIFPKAALQASVVYAGMLGNGACLFLVNVFLGRFLDKASFGSFSLAILALSTLAELSDFGLNAGFLRYGSYYSARGEEGKLLQLVRLVWRWRVRLSVLLTVFGVAFARPIAEIVLNAPALAGTLAFSFLGVGGTVFLGFVATYLQLRERYVANAVVQFLKGFLRFAFIYGIVHAGFAGPYALVLGFIVVPWILFIFVSRLLPAGFYSAPSFASEHVAVARQLKSYSFWIALWSFAAIFAGRVEQIVLSSLMGLEAVAVFAAASQFMQAYSLGAQAVSTVLAPKAGAIRSAQELSSLMHRSFRPLIWLSFALIPFIILSSRLIPLVFRASYADAMPVYIVLSIGYIGFMLNAPFSLAISAYNKTVFYAVLGAFQVVLSIALNYLFIPSYGVLGAALAFTVTSFVILAATGACASYLMRTREIAIT